MTQGDSVEVFIRDNYESGHRLGTLELIKTMCEDSLETIPFLESLGFVFDREDKKFRTRRPIGASYPRGYRKR